MVEEWVVWASGFLPPFKPEGFLLPASTDEDFVRERAHDWVAARPDLRVTVFRRVDGGEWREAG